MADKPTRVVEPTDRLRALRQHMIDTTITAPFARDQRVRAEDGRTGVVIVCSAATDSACVRWDDGTEPTFVHLGSIEAVADERPARARRDDLKLVARTLRAARRARARVERREARERMFHVTRQGNLVIDWAAGMRAAGLHLKTGRPVVCTYSDRPTRKQKGGA